MHIEPVPAATKSAPARMAAAGRTSSITFDHVLSLVAKEKRVPIRLILNNSRCRLPAARARQLAMYLAHVVHGETLTTIGEVFRRDRTTVSYACGVIEDLRDDPAFDAEVTRLEEMLQNGSHDHG